MARNPRRFAVKDSFTTSIRSGNQTPGPNPSVPPGSNTIAYSLPFGGSPSISSSFISGIAEVALSMFYVPYLPDSGIRALHHVVFTGQSIDMDISLGVLNRESYSFVETDSYNISNSGNVSKLVQIDWNIGSLFPLRQFIDILFVFKLVINNIEIVNPSTEGISSDSAGMLEVNSPVYIGATTTGAFTVTDTTWVS